MKKIVTLLIAMLALAGCPDGGSKGNNNNYNNYGMAGCVNCGFNAAVFSQAVSSQIPQASLNIQLAGDANQMNMWGSNGQNPLFSYQGPISITGTLTVNSLLPFGMCQLPAGQYTMQTIQAGIYSMGTFQIPAVELVGPIRMVVAIAEGTVLTNGNGMITSFGAVLLGQQGPVLMGGWGMQQGVSLSSCNDGIGVRF